jgi:hypothetical protein
MPQFQILGCAQAGEQARGRDSETHQVCAVDQPRREQPVQLVVSAQWNWPPRPCRARSRVILALPGRPSGPGSGNSAACRSFRSSGTFEKSLNITLNSLVFRSSGQDLTTAGTYIEMTSRLVEPTLLALAILAVRGRIKR